MTSQQEKTPKKWMWPQSLMGLKILQNPLTKGKKHILGISKASFVEKYEIHFFFQFSHNIGEGSIYSNELHKVSLTCHKIKSTCWHLNSRRSRHLEFTKSITFTIVFKLILLLSISIHRFPTPEASLGSYFGNILKDTFCQCYCCGELGKVEFLCCSHIFYQHFVDI